VSRLPQTARSHSAQGGAGQRPIKHLPSGRIWPICLPRAKGTSMNQPVDGKLQLFKIRLNDIFLGARVQCPLNIGLIAFA
jgi:hypothetical protein